MLNNYDSESLKVLKGLEAVRKRPGMYIGSTDVNGLHHLIWEIVDNAMDEVLANYATCIKVNLEKDGSIIIEDDGRGIPIDKHKDSGMTGVELVFTELHAGGKFGQDGSAYKISGGLHGVGSSVVNALSNKLVATIFRNNKEHETIFTKGVVTQSTKVIGSTSKRGTRIQFWPDYKIFKNSKFSFGKIVERLRESSFLVSGVEIKVKDKINGVNEDLQAKDGVKEFVEFINGAKTAVSSIQSFNEIVNNIEIDIAFQYTDDYNETILSFVNNVKTKEGGSHVIGFKNAWTKVVNQYAREESLLKTKEPNLEGDDTREGLTAIISLKIPENILEFVGQTKDSLRTPIAKSAVEAIIQKNLSMWLQQNKKDAYKIINKTIGASKARNAARMARQEVRSTKKKMRERKILSGKLTPAQSKDASKRELFLVEGDSAGGSAKLGRDRKYQAILPLRGKVINTEKAKLLDILKNEEIGTIITTIGAGVSSEFKIKDAQYGKVVVMTDADTDGAHIQTLLLTFLFRYMRPLIENGHVYIALPPLYKIYKKTKNTPIEKYAWDDSGLKELLDRYKGAEVQRYKGLGEMNANQLWDTTMNPETRTLIQVTIDDIALVERRVSTLMGDKAELRKEWINQNVDFSNEDDFNI